MGFNDMVWLVQQWLTNVVEAENLLAVHYICLPQ